MTVVGDVAYVSVFGSDRCAIVDAADAHLVEGARWRINRAEGKLTYASRIKKMQYYPMHNAIIGYRPGYVTDHINGNKLDNRRCNLRHCSSAENNYNKRACKKNKIGLKGVIAFGKGFRAQIKANGRTYDLGVYSTASEASASYCGASIILQGSYANFLDSVLVEKPEGL